MEKKNVLVPGLGTFRISFSNSRSLHDGQLLCPPQNILSFDPNAKLPDLELAKEIARQSGTSYSEAHGLIDGWVKEIIDGTIEPESRHDVEGLGSFYKDNRKALCFVQQDGLNLHPSSFGLFPLVTGIKGNKEIIELNDNEDDSSKKRKPWRALWIVIPVVILAAAVASYFFIPEVKKEIDTVIGFKSPEPIVAPVKPKADTVIVSRKDTTQMDTTNVENPNGKGNKYYIVAGSFEQEENATKLKNELLVKGFKPEVVRNGKWYVVSYNSFFNKDFANRSLEKIKSGENPNAYLLIR
ncbi:MAG: SPOR domain-containing protein [Bacteroidota bacterium]